MAFPTLNQNTVISSLVNLIISQELTFTGLNNTNSSLADMSRVDGTLYGDTKEYITTDVSKTYDWLNDAEAQNLLKLHRPVLPDVQTITINQYRMIPMTISAYLDKQAFMNEGTFSQFNSQVLAWISLTKKVYDATLFNSFVGTHVAGLENDGVGAKQNHTIALPAEPDGVDDYNTEAYNRIVAQIIAQEVADLIVELGDVSRDFTDFGNLRSFGADELVFVWNSEWVNKIKKTDTPTIFHKDGLIDKLGEHTLPARYFGNVNKNGGTTSGTNITVRSLIEKDYNTVEPNSPTYDKSKHIFPGDLLPANTAYGANETYTQDSTIVFKAYHKKSIPFMTSFSTRSEFFNPRSLTSTHYLIWGYNNLETLKDYPFITAKVQVAG